MRFPTLAATVLVIAVPAVAADVASSIDPATLPAHKVTTDAKYLSTQDAYRMIWDEPSILFVDVRDTIEVAQQGHPEKIDAIVPVRIQTYETRAMPQTGPLVDNPNFLERMAEVMAVNNKSRHDLVILTCGSGRRSAMAAQILSDAGYTNVYHVTDGYEGDDAIGYNARNAWKEAGLPWSMNMSRIPEWQLEIVR